MQRSHDAPKPLEFPWRCRAELLRGPRQELHAHDWGIEPGARATEVVQPRRGKTPNPPEYARLSLGLSAIRRGTVDRDPHDDVLHSAVRAEIGHFVHGVAVAAVKSAHRRDATGRAADDL